MIWQRSQPEIIDNLPCYKTDVCSSNNNTSFGKTSYSGPIPVQKIWGNLVPGPYFPTQCPKWIFVILIVLVEKKTLNWCITCHGYINIHHLLEFSGAVLVVAWSPSAWTVAKMWSTHAPTVASRWLDGPECNKLCTVYGLIRTPFSWFPLLQFWWEPCL